MPAAKPIELGVRDVVMQHADIQREQQQATHQVVSRSEAENDVGVFKIALASCALNFGSAFLGLSKGGISVHPAKTFNHIPSTVIHNPIVT